MTLSFIFSVIAIVFALIAVLRASNVEDNLKAFVKSFKLETTSLQDAFQRLLNHLSKQADEEMKAKKEVKKPEQTKQTLVEVHDFADIVRIHHELATKHPNVLTNIQKKLKINTKTAEALNEFVNVMTDKN